VSAPGQPRQLRVWLVLCLAVLLFTAGAGHVVGATNSPSTTTNTDGGFAAEPGTGSAVPYENETVVTAFESGGDLTFLTSGDHTIDLDVSAEIIGKGADIDDDWYVEVPYITSDNELYVIDRTGEKKELTEDAANSNTKLAATEFEGTSGVIYTSTGGSIKQVTYDSVETELASNGVGALGVGDITGNEEKEVIYIGSNSDQPRYYNSSTSDTGRSISDISVAYNGGLGAGSPRDFDNDNRVEVPVVDGSNILYYVGMDEDRAVSTDESAGKYPVGSQDITGDSTPELLYVTSSNKNIRYVTADGEQEAYLKNADGNRLSTTSSAGVAYVDGTEEPLVVANLTLVNDSGTLRGAFNSSVALSEINARITNQDGHSYSPSNFTETVVGSDYRYITNHTPGADGNYTLRLDSVTATDGEEATPGLTANATIDKRFDIYGLNATGAAGQNLTINLSADEDLDGLEVTVSGAENETLGLSDFSEEGSNAPYTYTATPDVNTYGTYNVTFKQGQSWDGQIDDDTMNDSATITEPFRVSNLTLVNQSGSLTTSFNSTKELDGVDLDVSGPDSQSFSVDNLTESSGGSQYTYTGNYTPSADGNYTAELASASAVDGGSITPDLTANATIEERFNVTNLSAAGGQNGPILVNFTATDPVDTVTINLSGPKNETLTMDAFSLSASGGPYVYNGSFNTSTAGEYTVAFKEAESTAGFTDNEELIANATISDQLDVWNFTLSNGSTPGNLSVGFQSSKELSGTDVDIQGPETYDLSLGNFTESGINGNYSYTTEFRTPDGSYDGTLVSASADGDSITPELTNSTTINARFNVTNLTASGQRDGPLSINFTATDPVETTTINITGPENATLNSDLFSTTDSNSPYVYNGSYNATTPGEYTVTFEEAKSTGGLTDDDTLNDTATIDDQLRVWNFTLSNGSTPGNLSVEFQSSKELSGTDVDIQGPEPHDLSLANFTQSDTNGNYTYTTEFVTPDGAYNGTLVSATAGNKTISPGLTNNTTITARFNVTNLSATGHRGGPLSVNFTATDPVDTVEINISGPENTTLGMDAFSLSDSGEPYVYNGSYNATTPGEYTVTFEEAKSTGGLTDDDTLNDTTTIDDQLRVWNFSLSSGADPENLSAEFHASDSLSQLDVTIQGSQTYDLTQSNFTEASTNGNYTYTTEFSTPDGTYNGTVRSVTNEDGTSLEPDLTDDTTINARFNVTNLSATGSQNGLLSLNFTATDPVDTVDIDISGPENETLGMDAFAVRDSSGPYVYNGTYNASTPGEYTITLDQAESTSGLVDDDTLNDTATIDDKLRVWNFTLTNKSSLGNLSVRFSASESLSTADVDIQGPETHDLGLSNFTEASTNGNYTYTTAFSTPDGTYNGTLRSVTTDDTSLNPDLADNTTINARFNVTNLSATGHQGGPLSVNFTATDPVDTVEIDITGPENTTLGMSSFSPSESGDSYVYNGTYNTSAPGTYTVRLQEAESTAGLIDDDSLNTTATIDDRLRVWNFTLANATTSGYLAVEFQSSAQLSGTDVDIQGPETYDLALSNFTASNSNGNYTYTTEFAASAGTYNGTLVSATAGAESATPDLTDTTTITTRFNVTNLTAAGTQGGPLSLNFTATDSVDTVKINISGPENATLGMDTFSTTNSSNPYVYSGTYNASSPGKYTVTFQRATGADGLVDDDSLTTNATIEKPLRVWNFTLSNGTSPESLALEFHASESLTSAEIDIQGPETYDLSESNLSEQGSSGNYTYTTEFSTADGTYEGTLVSAQSTDGESITPDLSDTTTISSRFNVTNLTASASQRGPLSINFTATDPVDTVEINIRGPENTTLGIADFNTTDSSDPYVYNGSYNASTPGEYTVTFKQAESTTNLVDTDSLTANATIDPTLRVWNLTLTDNNGTLQTTFSASKSLTGITARVDGPDPQSFTRGNFSETATNGNYTYTARYRPDADGNYTATLSAVTTGQASLNPDLTASATVNERFDVRNLTATLPTSRTIAITFEATDRLGTVTVDVAGPDPTSLDLDAFSTNDSTAPFEYTGQHNVSAAGNYTITFVEGTSQHGHDDSENLTDVVEIDERLNVTDLRLTNVSGNLSITFNASEELASAPVEVSGVANHTLAIDAFSETTTNGVHRYETQYQPPGDGEYTAELDTATGVDGDTWSGMLTTNETIDTRTLGVNVTLRDQTDGNGIVNATDQVRIIANVSGSATRAAFDRIAFSNGTPTLAHIGGNTFATNATVGNLTSGPYNVRVRAFGTSGHEASATSNNVLVDTGPPVANITVEDTVTRGSSTRLAALTTSDDETQIVDAAWQVNGETIAGNESLLEQQATAPLRLYSGTTARAQKTATTTTDVQNVTYTFEETGTHTVSLTVVDAAGNTNTDTTSVTVTEQSTQQPPATPDDDDDDGDATPMTTVSGTTATPTTTAATSTTPTATQSPSNTTAAPNTPTQTPTTVDRTKMTDTNSPPGNNQSPTSSGETSTEAPVPDEGGIGGGGEQSLITVDISWAFAFTLGVIAFLGIPLYYFKGLAFIPRSLPVPLLFWMRDEEQEDEENDTESDEL